jgi:hypothetical protein
MGTVGKNRFEAALQREAPDGRDNPGRTVMGLGFLSGSEGPIETEIETLRS